SFDVRKGAAVKDRNLEVVEFDISVVDAHAIERREQMFHRRYPYSPAHQRCCIRDARYRCNIGSKLEVIKIDAAENDPFAGGSRKNLKRWMLPGMKADFPGFEGVRDGLVAHSGKNIANE